MSDIAIRIEHLSKKYRLGVINNGVLFQDIQTWLAIKSGKEDPYSKIGENKYATNEDYFWALKNINIEIKQGDRAAIIGKNGAGKSTLLKLLSRVTSPTEGTIKIKGKITSLLEVGTGFHGELTGRENIYLNGAILGMKKRRTDQIIDEIIAFSGIEEHIDTPVKRYSSGMYVRLAFAVAAHLDSDILIADEVLAVGDTEFQKKALGKMQDLSTDQGRTVLFVSHNIEAVKTLCNTGILLQQGRVIYQGNIDEAINAYSPKIEKDKITHWEGIDGDENLKLYKAEITKKNETISELSIVFEVLVSNNTFVFSIPFFNVDEVQLCVSTDSEILDDNDYNLLCQNGVHSITLNFDTSIFAPGEYFIEFDFAIHKIKRLVSPNIKLFFKTDSNNQMYRHPSPVRENTIIPEWKWDLI
ncbi:MAG: ABC transporter ATP-binding protein [Bacteroidales bacterium]|jgi:lipopolysaccharide transport system ATP-binding protein|nr:ABC transporter ATP-binding protein [Bacteroidales bacterium]